MEETKKKKILKAVLLILAVVNALYGIAVRLIHSESPFFIVWIVIAMGFLFLYYAVDRDLFLKIKKEFRISIIMVVLLFFIYFVVCEAGIIGQMGSFGTEEDLDYVIVLGAKVNDDGPSVSLRYRLDKALEYLKLHPDTVCIVTGGKGPSEPVEESHSMKEYLLEKGLEESRIIVEDKSQSTYENLRNCLEYIDEKNETVGIVTNNYHVYRAMKIADKAGYMKVFGIAAHSPAAFVPNNMLREFLAITKDRLSGNI